MKTLGGIVVAGALAIAPLWEYALHDYQRNRVLAFINPALDPATAWQPREAMNAVSSGRFIGKGFLQGTQIRLRSLPALWTDFPLRCGPRNGASSAAWPCSSPMVSWCCGC